MKERDFQSSLIKKIKNRYSDCMVLKNDPNYIQGIPDLLILHKGKWAALECKKESDSKKQPNQDYYIDKMSSMSYANFISPNNQDQVFKELDSFFN